MTRRLVIAAVGTVAATACVLWVDRPLAGALAAAPGMRGVTTFGSELRVPLRVAIFGVVLLGALASASWERRETTPGRLFLMTAPWVATISLLASIVLQHLIGHSSLDLYLATGVESFQPLSRDPNYTSLPSGSAAMLTAVGIVGGRYYPRARPIIAAGVVVFALALVPGANHWLSDIVSGVALGAIVASGERLPPRTAGRGTA